MFVYPEQKAIAVYEHEGMGSAGRLAKAFEDSTELAKLYGEGSITFTVQKCY